MYVCRSKHRDILTVRFNILRVLSKSAFVGKKNFDVIKMHGTTIKKLMTIITLAKHK
jgi:hypothetical protein